MGSIWNDVAFLEKAAKFAPYIFIVLGFLITLFGQYVRTAIESRVKDLKAQAGLSRKRTPPLIEALLAFDTTSSRIILVIKTKNEIPFKARWLVVTTNNKVISGIMIQDAEFHPSSSQDTWYRRVNIPENEVVDSFIELHFTWESVYWAEFGQASDLKGSITRAYRLVDGKPAPITQ